jgi:hypothetical protein
LGIRDSRPNADHRGYPRRDHAKPAEAEIQHSLTLISYDSI